MVNNPNYNFTIPYAPESMTDPDAIAVVQNSASSVVSMRSNLLAHYEQVTND